MSRPLRVLLLEDNASDAILIFRELKRAGLEAIGERVETEGDFRAQLELGPDVVLADFLQPEFDALRALKIVQETSGDTPVIVITGAIGDEAAVEVVKAGAADYLVKDRLARLGQAVRHVLAQKEALVDRRRAERALQESEARKTAILEAAGDAIITIDENDLIESANRAAIRMFGYTREEIQGQHIGLVMPLPDCERGGAEQDSPVMSACERMLGVALEAIGHKKDGARFPIERTVTDLHLGDRRLFTATIRDISERKKAELELLQRTTELARSNIELEQFASIASHDLQEPLRTIGGFAQLLARRYTGQLDSSADEFISYIVAGVTRMQTLINDLLEYSRLGTRGIKFRRVSCEDVVKRAIADLNGSIEATGAVITYDKLPDVWADGSQLSQLFQNLIANAIHYRAQVPPRVHISVEVEVEYWRFSIRDNGIGFDPKQSERIFVLFQRLHTTEQYPGSGMGLAVCKKIVERHFGADMDGIGTRQGFLFLLHAARERSPTMRRQANLHSIEILLVEDNLSDIRLTTEILRECGILVNVSVVRDGEELSYLRRAVGNEEAPQPTLILLDLNLPKRNGFEVLDEVKKDPLLRRIPVIVLTTSTAERDIARSYDLHANCYISKPARLESLIELLQSISSFWFQMVQYSPKSVGPHE